MRFSPIAKTFIAFAFYECVFFSDFKKLLYR